MKKLSIIDYTECALTVPAVRRALGIRKARQENLKRKRDVSDALVFGVPDRHFFKYFRMEKDNFMELVDILTPFLRKIGGLKRNPRMPIPFIVGAGLRFVQGDQSKSIEMCFQMSMESVYKSVWLFIDAVNSCLPDIRFQDDTNATLESFRNIGELRDCIGAVDGTLIPIMCPGRQVSNPRSYYSGKDQSYGVVVIASCDGNCRLNYVSAKYCGCMNDKGCFSHSALSNYLDDLDDATYIIADNGFVCNKHVLTPYRKLQLSEALANDDYHAYLSMANFNYHLASSRVSIERAFGILKARFQCFQKRLRIPVPKIPKFILAISKLHNFFIDHLDNYTHEDIGGAIGGRHVEGDVVAAVIDVDAAVDAGATADGVQRRDIEADRLRDRRSFHRLTIADARAKGISRFL